MLFGMAMLAIGFRTLSPSMMGVFALAVLVSGLAGVWIAGVRLPAAMAVAAATDTRQELRFLTPVSAGLLVASLPLWVVGALLLVPSPSRLGVPDSRMVGLLVVSTAYGVANACYPAAARGRRHYWLLLVANVAGSALGLLATVLTIEAWQSTSLGLGYLVTAVLTNLVLRLRSPRIPALLAAWRDGGSCARKMWTVSRPFVLSSAVWQGLGLFSAALVAHFAGLGASAEFRAGIVVPTACYSLGSSAIEAVGPVLARWPDGNLTGPPARMARWVSASIGTVFGVVIGMAPYVAVLITGQASAVVTRICVISAAGWLLSSIALVSPLLLLRSRRSDVISRTVPAELVLSVGLALLLVSPMGAVGVAVAGAVAGVTSRLIVMPAFARAAGVGLCPALRLTGSWTLVPCFALAAVGWVVRSG